MLPASFVWIPLGFGHTRYALPSGLAGFPMVAHNGVHVDGYRAGIPIRRRASTCSRRKRGSSAVLVVATLMSHGALLLGATMNAESVYV